MKGFLNIYTILFNQQTKHNQLTDIINPTNIPRMNTLITNFEKKQTQFLAKEHALAEKVRIAKDEYTAAKAVVVLAAPRFAEPFAITGTYNYILDRTAQLKQEKRRVFEPLEKTARKAFDNFKKQEKALTELLYENKQRLTSLKDTIEEKQCFMEEQKLTNMMPLAKIDKLPEDMVYYEIGEFLTYDNQIKLMVGKYNPVKLLQQIGGFALIQLLRTIVTERDYYSGIDQDKANALFAEQPENWGLAGTWWRVSVKSEGNLRQKIVNIFNRYKNDNPKALYKWFRRLVILIKPDKNYRYSKSMVRPLTAVPIIN